ncbi:hypothetical protein DFH08DRAFT_949474 [Mycena albidolilacea]|uniref:Uncharacterized protein n=1 Tax=Mycena albidolilacea TaxID=1033008 RepID=A0AAD7ANE7_9AGAR|nr:hypothetical protein DFH08DRAFT_949474 [Mycena albidolilacea]
MEDGIGMGECSEASGHAPTQVVPVAAEKLEQAEFRAPSHDSELTSPNASKKQLENRFVKQAPAQGTRRTPVTQDYVDLFAPPVVVEHGGLKGVHEEFANSDGAGTLTVHSLVCSCCKGLPRARTSPIEPSPVLFQACLHECPAPSTVELGGLNATSPHGTVNSGRGSSETDEQGVVSKVRTLVCSDRASSNTLAHTSRLASSLSSSSSFSPSPSILPLVLSPFSPLVPSASVITYLDFALVSAILWTFWMTYLVWIKCEDAAPCLAWEQEGIGTGPWN